MERRLFEKIKQHKEIFIVVLLILLFAVYLFYPRNLYNRIFGDGTEFYVIKIGDVSIDAENKTENDSENGIGEVQLNDQQREEIRSLLRGQYACANLFHKKSVSGDGTGYYCIVLNESGDMVYFFSQNIISINGKQYRVYNRSLEVELIAIIEN